MPSPKAGDIVDQGPYVTELDFERFRMRVTTERYSSRQFQQREREMIWMRVWQIAGRVDELPEAGSWKEYRLFDQSFVIVRGKDGALRGFVNACRHRGNILCEGKGRSARFTCPFHGWTYDLDGRLLAVASPLMFGPIDKAEHALLPASVESFAGFIFLNPDPHAAPLADFLGEAAALLAPYHIEEWVPVGLNARETLDCNWKVVMEAFQEGYHVAAIHPQLRRNTDMSKQRYSFFGDHSVVSAPFGASDLEAFGPEREVEGILELPETFPGMADVMPRFEELVAAYRNADECLDLPEGVTARALLQQATRETRTRQGMDVSGLTDTQMSDNHIWLLFPNVFMTIRVGETILISALPHPEGDPNRCIWQVVNYRWLPPDQRTAQRMEVVDVPADFSFGLAIDQDREQMPRQQRGLRNRALEYVDMGREEVRIAHFHAALERHLAGQAAS